MTEIERTDCARCGGDGQIIKGGAAGRAGYYECPNCDNVPKYAVPEDPPEDPHERIAEIDAEIEELNARKEEWEQDIGRVHDAQDALKDASGSDFFDSETKAVLDHIVHQIELTVHDNGDVGYGISMKKDQLGREKAELQTYIDALQEQEAETDG